MSILKLLVMIVFVTVVNAPFTVDGAGAKTYLGVSGISFDYIPFWYAKDYRLYEKYNVDVDMITTGGGPFWRKPCYRAASTLRRSELRFYRARCKVRIMCC